MYDGNTEGEPDGGKLGTLLGDSDGTTLGRNDCVGVADGKKEGASVIQ